MRRPLPTIRIHRHRSSLHFCPTTKLLEFRLRPILDVLPEMAHMAPDFLVRLEAEWDNGDEAEGKPFPALHYATRGVAAVLADELDVFGAFEGGCEGWGDVSERTERDGGRWCGQGIGREGTGC